MLSWSLFVVYLVCCSLVVHYLPMLEQPDWWVKIITAKPHCVYYFGPFSNAVEAQVYQSGYIEDLQEEGAEGISVAIEQCQPQFLTVAAEEE